MDITTSDDDRNFKHLLDKKNICRDYLRNVCQRGRRCKYKHPSATELEEIVDVSCVDVVYEFCHDFQNSQCQRLNCRFIHCSKEEEELYNTTKKLPLKLKLQFDFGIGDCFLGHDKHHFESEKPLDPNSPVCWDFINRECFRGRKCKFVHLDPQQAAKYEAELSAGIKRPRILMDDKEGYDEDCNDFTTFSSSQEMSGGDIISKHLQEENQSLKKRIQELEKQVSDLSATNEVLLEQNAQFRLQKRGIQGYGRSSESMTSFKPTVGLSTPANLPQNVVASNTPQAMPVQLNVQVTGQPNAQDLMNGAAGQPPPPQATVVAAGARLQQVPVSVPQTTDIAAQVIAANLAANSGNNVESIQGANQMVSALSGQMPHSNAMIAQNNLNQMPQQPIASFSAPVPNQLAQQQPQPQQQNMGSFAGGMPTHNQMSQQPVSFAGTIMAAALAGGRCAIQAATNTLVTLSGDVHRSSMGHAVQLPPPAVVYTVTRSTGNMPLASTVVSGTGHEMTLVAETQRNAVSSMPGPLHPVGHPAQAFNNVSPGNQGIVQASSHQNTGMPCAPLTSGIAAANTSMPPSVSMGAVRPALQNSLVASAQVNAGPRPVVPTGPTQMNEQGIIAYPIAAVQPAPMHN
uniref:Zinc finger CCCH domain-containing protein 10 n=1 Tax=Phallusia mammillata TaxID=59560 RepID=A0A6F9DWS8_9ASCI|nr:zinc finger CCCH domain-containing protein 10 [Phallusia mammillata]